MRYPNVVPHHLAVGSHPSAVGRQVRNLPASCMRCSTCTPACSTATSATSRRWQRHHTLSLHIIAGRCRVAWSSNSVKAAANSAVRVWAAYAANCSTRHQGSSHGVPRGRRRRPPSRGSRRYPIPRLRQPLCQCLAADVGVAAAAGIPSDIDDGVDGGGMQQRCECLAIEAAVSHRNQHQATSSENEHRRPPLSTARGRDEMVRVDVAVCAPCCRTILRIRS